MKPPVAELQDFCAGALFCGVGTATIAGASHHPFGTAMRMGAGYFPLLLGVLLCVAGLIVLARAALAHRRRRRDGGGRLSRPASRRIAARRMVRQAAPPAAWIGIGVLAFAGLLGSIGLAGAILALVALSGAAHHEADWRELLPLGLGMAVFGTSVFVWGLGLPLPVLPL
ncbi:MAG: tripartite tricarboxylate transporter TctB family protein [Azoarcus sp.]|jgi:hypothetical protein|nr:tripartite tricarboxylate transporter TctB family protein [Azoarcus sp.]